MEKNDFDLEAYYKSLEEDESLKEYEEKSSEADKNADLINGEEDLGAMEAMILENEAAVGFTRNQKK